MKKVFEGTVISDGGYFTIGYDHLNPWVFDNLDWKAPIGTHKNGGPRQQSKQRVRVTFEVLDDEEVCECPSNPPVIPTQSKHSIGRRLREWARDHIGFDQPEHKCSTSTSESCQHASPTSTFSTTTCPANGVANYCSCSKSNRCNTKRPLPGVPDCYTCGYPYYIYPCPFRPKLHN